MYIGIVIALCFTVVFGLMSAYAIIDYFIFSDVLEWFRDYNYPILDQLPKNVSFLVIASICLFVLSRKAHSVSLVSMEGIWGILSKIIVLGIITGGALLTLVPLALVLSRILEGDISVNAFVTFIVTVIAGIIIFYYYSGVLHDKWRNNIMHANIYAAFVSFLMIFVIAVSIYILNPISRSNLLNTYENMRALDSAYKNVLLFYNENNVLPLDVTDESFLFDKSIPVYDQSYLKETYKKIEYTRITNRSFKLCATFDAFPQKTNFDRYPYEAFNVKELGKSCFDFNV